jgi:AraC-like DNA-binding protein
MAGTDYHGWMPGALSQEWSRYYRLSSSVEALHAQFVEHRYPRHAHDFLVVGLVETGAQSYSYRGARHITPAGQVFIVNAGEPHTGESATASGYVYRTLYLREAFFADLAEDIGTRSQTPFLKGAVLDDQPLARLLARFHRSLIEQATSVERESTLLDAGARLLRTYGDPHLMERRIAREHPAVKRAREYLEAHFDQDVSLMTLANLVTLSPYYFARAFEKETGLPPHAYLESIRIAAAKRFLDQGLPIVETALSVGYADQSHLTRRFKRFLGMTPGQYSKGSTAIGVAGLSE